jgi:hypothetical protein
MTDATKAEAIATAAPTRVAPSAAAIEEIILRFHPKRVLGTEAPAVDERIALEVEGLAGC